MAIKISLPLILLKPTHYYNLLEWLGMTLCWCLYSISKKHFGPNPLILRRKRLSTTQLLLRSLPCTCISLLCRYFIPCNTRQKKSNDHLNKTLTFVKIMKNMIFTRTDSFTITCICSERQQQQ